MKPVVVAKILQEALHGILALPLASSPDECKKKQILILKGEHNISC